MNLKKLFQRLFCKKKKTEPKTVEDLLKKRIDELKKSMK